MITQARINELSSKYDDYVTRSYEDLATRSGLDLDFIHDCVEILQEKKRQEGRLPIGEMFPLIVTEGLSMPLERRRQLAMACLTIHGYIRLVDSKLDKHGVLNSRSALSASALLTWGISVLSDATANSEYSALFLSNVTAALSAQYSDLKHRTKRGFDRTPIDIDKNRAIVGIVAAFCAASGGQNDRLVKATELLLRPFQRIDDLADVYEDVREDNMTFFAQIAAERAPQSELLSSMTANELYGFIVDDPRVMDELACIESGIRNAISLLDTTTDDDLIIYLSYIQQSVATLMGLLDRRRSDDEHSMKEIRDQIDALRVDV